MLIKYILSNIWQFRCQKWIAGEILAYKHLPIVWFIIFIIYFYIFDEFVKFYWNGKETINLDPHQRKSLNSHSGKLEPFW